jgi:hypothetical protein
MAEIRVEPKRKAPIWPWIIGILILLGLIWLLVEAFDRDDDYEDRREDTELENDTISSLPAHEPHTLVLTSFNHSTGGGNSALLDT